MENPPTYLVCATHRSGSNLLCQALWHTDICGRPQEFFSPTRAEKIVTEHGLDADPEAEYAGYLRALVAERATENGVFGGKIMWAHLKSVRDHLGAPEDANMAELLRDAFPNLHFIHARRDDTLRQAISMSKAKQTKIYNSLQNETRTPADRELRFDYEEIRKTIDRFVKEDEAWETFFEQNEITPFEVRYEAFVDRYEETTREIVEFLGIPIPENFQVKPTTYKKLADEVNEDWRRRYLEMQAESA